MKALPATILTEKKKKKEETFLVKKKNFARKTKTDLVEETTFISAPM